MIAKTWEWLKKNWKWILLPVGVLLWLMGRGSKQTVIKVESPLLTEHENYQTRIAAEAAEKVRAATKAREEHLEALRKANAEAIDEITATANQKAAELQKNPDDVNAFLKGVGASIRSPTKKG